MSSLLDELKKNPFVLAPMAGITDRAFRSFMRELGAGPVVTELVSATGLKYSSEKTKKLMEFDSIQHPIGIQIFGEVAEDLSYAAATVEQMGADFVDINFGCPVPKVVKKGAGAAALKDLQHFTQIIKAVVRGTKLPVTIKVRTGWDAQSRNTHEAARIAYNEGVTWVAIHGRTRAQGYSGLSDWDFIAEVKAQASLPILGNGDIVTAQQARDRLLSSGCDGVLIGRGCLKNPWLFLEARGLRVEKNFSWLLDRLYFYLQQSSDDRTTGLQIKKLSAWYSAGYPGSAQFRKDIFRLQTPQEILLKAKEYFFSLQNIQQQDTSQEAFLMGGHG